MLKRNSHVTLIFYRCLCGVALDIASVGLEERGYGEKILLEPLYERAQRLTNPAKEMVSGLENGKTMEHYIKEYGTI